MKKIPFKTCFASGCCAGCLLLVIVTLLFALGIGSIADKFSIKLTDQYNLANESSNLIAQNSHLIYQEGKIVYRAALIADIEGDFDTLKKAVDLLAQREVDSVILLGDISSF